MILGLTPWKSQSSSCDSGPWRRAAHDRRLRAQLRPPWTGPPPPGLRRAVLPALTLPLLKQWPCGAKRGRRPGRRRAGPSGALACRTRQPRLWPASVGCWGRRAVGEVCSEGWPSVDFPGFGLHVLLIARVPSSCSEFLWLLKAVLGMCLSSRMVSHLALVEAPLWFRVHRRVPFPGF